ncbi:MAG: NUDIX domain-containing protein [Gemmatimonadaceae bacterium]
MAVAPSGTRAAAAPPDWALSYQASDYPPFAYTADVLVFSVNHATAGLEGLFIRRARPPFARHDAFPGGFVEWGSDRSAEAAATRELREETGQTVLEYLEPLDTYDEIGRDPRQFSGHPERDGSWIATGARIVSKAFLAVVRPEEAPPVVPEPGEDASDAFWRDVYQYLPWEDLRSPQGRAAVRELRRRLVAGWARDAEPPDARQRAAAVARLFGRRGLLGWNEERAPERLAMLMDAGLVEESTRDQWGSPARRLGGVAGVALAFDHRRMLADAVGRLRGKMKYAPAALSALLGPRITSVTLHRACEAIAGRPIHLANLRRAFATAGLLEEDGFLTGAAAGPGRPARQYRWASGITEVRLDQALKIPWVPLTTR